MGIEDFGAWDTEVEQPEAVDEAAKVDDPRRHMLGGFRPGQGFGPSETETNAPDFLDFDDDASETPADSEPFPTTP